MPRDLTTKYTPLGAGIFIARKGDAIHIITTDGTAPDLRCVDQNDGLGGSTPHAYLAPKAEQDRLAAQLWADGRGAGNWVCAALVGVI